jgi:acyl dehydratase
MNADQNLKKSIDDYEVMEPFPEWISQPLTLGSMVRFAGASGDFNPIHFDPSFAKLAMIDRPVAHGAMLVETCTAFLADLVHFSRIRKVSARFKKPVLCGETILIRGSVIRKESEGDLKVKLSIFSQGSDEEKAAVHIRIANPLQ